MKKVLLVLTFCLLAVIFIFAGNKTIYCPKGSKCSSEIAEKAIVPLSPAVTLTPSLTSTLTPQQIAEIKKKQFEEMNAKYGPCRYVPILTYHHILLSSEAKEMGVGGLNVDNGVFRQQMDYLIGRGYQTIDLGEMINMLKGNFLPAKPIVLTFDDGYRDFYTNVFPILKEKRLKATVFVISQFNGGDKYLLWEQVSEMANSGLVSIGDHTLNHSSLAKLAKAQQADQIISARSIIEGYIGKRVNTFAYPYGSSNPIGKEVLKENGFLAAVTTIPGRTQCAGLPYDLQRIRIGGASLASYGL